MGSAQAAEGLVPHVEVPEGLSATEWSTIRAAYEAGRHSADPVDGGYRFDNPGQQWQTAFDGHGFATDPETGGWSWGLELARFGFAGQDRILDRPEGVTTEGSRVTYDWDGNLMEWNVNDGRGLEHGYTVHQQPLRDLANADPGPLYFALAVRGNLAPTVKQSGRDVASLDRAGAAPVTDSGLTVFDADDRVLPADFEVELHRVLNLMG